MNDDSKECDCLTFRKLYESGECGHSLSASEQNSFDLHKSNCKSCSGFCLQHEEIAGCAGGLPQFDVSEGLTQRILDSIERQSTPRVETSILPIGLAACVAFFVMVPFDSLQSLYGWGAGILGLFLLQLLMRTANSQEQVI